MLRNNFDYIVFVHIIVSRCNFGVKSGNLRDSDNWALELIAGKIRSLLIIMTYLSTYDFVLHMTDESLTEQGIIQPTHG